MQERSHVAHLRTGSFSVSPSSYECAREAIVRVARGDSRVRFQLLKCLANSLVHLMDIR